MIESWNDYFGVGTKISVWELLYLNENFGILGMGWGALLHTTDCSRQLSLQYKQLQYFTTPDFVFVWYVGVIFCSCVRYLAYLA